MSTQKNRPEKREMAGNDGDDGPEKQLRIVLLTDLSSKENGKSQPEAAD